MCIFIDEIMIDTYEFSTKLFVYSYASVKFIQEKLKCFSSNMFHSMVVYTPNDQCSDVVNEFDKNDLRHADFVKINEFIEYSILSIL
mgnify:CR=1 FL=1